MNNFGPADKRLTWDTEKPQTTVNFLDLTVTITPTGTISTKTFQKTDNTYLYRPPTSCQPPSILRSFVYGSLHRYYWQNTNENDFLQMISLLKQRLQARGHRHIDLVPIFMTALKKVFVSSLPNPRSTNNNKQTTNNNHIKPIFLHLPYHPNNPPKEELKSLTNEFKNDLNQLGLPLERIILAYSKAPCIGDLCKKHRLEGFIDTSGSQQK